MTITAVTPRLVVDDAAQAIGFYVAAFGAVERERHTDDATGRVVHALVEFDGIALAVKDEGDGDLAPDSACGTPVVFTLDTPDARGLAGRMIAAGATVVFAVEDHGYGYLDGRLADPSGHLWIVSQKL